MKFTDRLWRSVEDIWNGYLEHPFVDGLGRGRSMKRNFSIG